MVSNGGVAPCNERRRAAVPHSPGDGASPAEGPAGVAAVGVAIFNVKFSPNLGDGIIAECLERELRLANPALRPMSIDLAGRSGFGRGRGRYRHAILRICEAMPPPVRAILLPALLKLLVRLRLAPRWRAAIAHCQAAIVGGGALMADADQNFPIKVSGALDCCARHGLPVAIYSVGVSPKWSPAGWRRIQQSLSRSRLVSMTARDARSQSTWRTLVGTTPLPQAGLAPDPGLLSSRHFSVTRIETPHPRVAICLTDPTVLRLHGRMGDSEKRLGDWMMALLQQLESKRLQVTLFTNGSPEDEGFLDRLMVRLRIAGMGSAARAGRFGEPEHLVRFIAAQDCVMAHRLHACITAYSFLIPSVGLLWDPKLAAFFDTVGRSRYAVDTLAQSPFEAAGLVAEALRDPVDPGRHADLLDEARRGIQRVAASLTGERACA